MFRLLSSPRETVKYGIPILWSTFYGVEERSVCVGTFRVPYRVCVVTVLFVRVDA